MRVSLPGRRSNRLTVTVTAALSVALLSAAAARADEYIVVVKDSADGAAVAARHGVKPRLVYRSALHGFAGDLGKGVQARLAADPDVRFTATDITKLRDLPMQVIAPGQAKYFEKLTSFAQRVTFGTNRVDADLSATADIDAIDDARVNADIAVIDSGIDSDNVDLNVAGGSDCTGRGRKPGEPTVYEDLAGHGTHVAGTAAAIDNTYGYVGVAPGARLWAVRVLDGQNFGRDSWVLCGLDWVAAHADTIDVTNMSLGDIGRSDGECGARFHDPTHVAICGVAAAGVTIVVSAGNNGIDASDAVPAAYPEVITASAMTDTDGRPGGLGPASCRSTELDDRFASFSNFGAVIDLAAPGVCVDSTYPNDFAARMSGTSMAAPHVSGAAALYLATHRTASPAAVRDALLAAREQYAMPGDPDGINEGVLNVAGF
jgi:subtilisin